MPVALAVGEPGGVGLGVAFGVPFATGGGSAPPAPIGVLVAVATGTMGVLVLVIGGFVGTGVAVGGFVGTGVAVGNVSVGVAVGAVVAVGIGVSVGIGVAVSTGNEVIPDVAVSNGMAIAVACVVVCIATMPMAENNNNAELTARARKTQYAILVDFLFAFIKPRIMNTSSERISAISAQYAQIVHF